MSSVNDETLPSGTIVTLLHDLTTVYEDVEITVVIPEGAVCSILGIDEEGIWLKWGNLFGLAQAGDFTTKISNE